jgi:cobalt/nickel transport system permease protein
MRLEALERHSWSDGPLHRIDPRWKLIATLLFVGVVVATPAGAWRWYAVEGLLLSFAIGLAGVAPGDLLRRWLGFFVLIVFLAVMIAPSHPARSTIGLPAVVFGILIKNSLALLAILTLTSVTPFARLLVALAQLRTPPVLVATLHFMYRYVHVLTEELDRMVLARRSRSFRRSGRLDWGILTGLIGVLFLRAMERGERVHAAMISRGWDGTLRSLEGADAP